MALIDTQQTMDAYIRDLLNRGDYSRHYSDDVVVEVRGTDQRYRGRGLPGVIRRCLSL